MNVIRRNIAQRQKHECPLMKPRMRNGEARTVKTASAIIQQIKVKHPRGIPDGAHPPENALDPMQAGKRLFNRERRFGGNHGIVEPGLVGNRHRRGFVPCRNRGNGDAVVRQQGDGGLTPLARGLIPVRCQIRTDPNQNISHLTPHPLPDKRCSMCVMQK